jgi:hypothetical protein
MKRIVAAALMLIFPPAALMCGGTTGREGLPALQSPDATMATPAATATTDDGGDSSVYTNTFDVALQYVDQALPEAAPPQDGGSGAEAGAAFPNCPPFLNVDSTGHILDPNDPNSLSNAQAELASDYAPDGSIMLALDGSACATYPWLGSVTVDKCVAQGPNPAQLGLGSSVPEAFDLLPPCNWAVDSGIAGQGPGAGRDRYDICMDLYRCLMSTRCYVNPMNNSAGLLECLCTVPPGDLVPGAPPTAFHTDCLKSAQGPCMNEELAAMELGGTVQAALMNAFATWTQPSHGPGFEGFDLNELFQDLEVTAQNNGAKCPIGNDGGQ